ncbi:MAG TPA: ATP-binding cassette domain-containing protein, partial [Chlamydiales bacterium]|nr:ATP-binding cassette domain-containing protein [Chlamydiales bacterium]
MNYALEVENLTVHYDSSPVLWDIQLKVPGGKFVGIVGPNGAGKSTFIQSLLGLVPLVSGEVLFFAQPLKQVKNRIAYIPQKESIDWDFPMTAKELVLMGCLNRLGVLK